MSESKFKKLKLELAVVQGHMSITDEDRPRVLQAMNGLNVADEMYELLEEIMLSEASTGKDDGYYEEIKQLLAKARGDG